VASPTPTGPSNQQAQAETKARVAAEKKRQRELDSLTREMARQQAKGLETFSAALSQTAAKIGLLFAGMRSLGTAAPTAVSTLQKSFDLVMAHLGTIFVPVLAQAIAGLQDFAGWLDENGKLLRVFGEGLGASTKFFTSKEFFKNSPGLGVFGMAAGLFKGLPAFADRQAGISPERRKNFEEFKKLDSRYQSAYDDAKGGKLGDTVQKYFQGLKPGVGANPTKFPKEVADELKRQGRLKDFEDFFGKKFDFNPEKGKGKGKGKDYLADFPPGYVARESGVADLRSQLQLQAFQKSPLEMEKMRIDQKNHELLIEQLRKIAENTGRGQGTGAPPRTA
jgi:hypothetical protein